MTRCAFLPANGDPYVLLHTAEYFKVWSSEVDKLYILFNSTIDSSLVEPLKKLLDHPKIVFFYVDHTMGHGEAINYLLDRCTEDSIMLIEDDSIIFKKGIVDTYFKIIESNSDAIVGSPRMSCPADVSDKLKVEFGLNYEGWGDKGPNLWPCFLFASRKNLLNTDRNFGASKFGDTFVNTSIQLRRNGCTFYEIPQYHCSPDDEQNKADCRGIFDGECGYMHFGSLSSGIENTLVNDDDIPLKDMIEPSAPPIKFIPTSGMEKVELEKRVMWWSEGYRLHITDFGYFSEIYGKAIEKVIKRHELSLENINNMRKMYHEVISNNCLA